VNIHTLILTFYFLVLFPITHLVFSDNIFIYDFWHILYFSAALIGVLLSKQISLPQLGFNKDNSRQSSVTGFLLGVLPVIGVVLLDGFLIKTGLSKSNLLQGADLRSPEETGFNLTNTGIFFTALIIPLVEQLFVTGYIVNNLLRKESTGRFMLSGGLIFSLLHFKLSLGNLVLGMVSAGLLRASGSLIAPILVHIGFVVAEILIVLCYPRLITLLVFLI
jgi:membrane protease YdiL (CAAX protease family)